MPNLMIVRNEYPDFRALKKVLSYAMSGSFIGGYAIDPNFAYEQMVLVKQAYYKTNGVQLKHSILSFEGGEMANLNFEDLLDIGFLMGKHFKEYQMVYGIHLDSDHVHIHFVMNTVSFIDGHKYADGWLPFQSFCVVLHNRFPYFNVDLLPSESHSKDNPYRKEKSMVYERY